MTARGRLRAVLVRLAARAARAGRAGTACRARRASALANGGDAGNAVVEFLGVALLLLVPTVYLVLVIGRVQAASFAAEGAAREAARVLSTAADPAAATARAGAAVELAFTDQGFHDVDAARALTFVCTTPRCDAADDDVSVRVTVDVALPAVPSFVQGVIPMSVTVSAESIAPLAPYAAGRP